MFKPKVGFLSITYLIHKEVKNEIKDFCELFDVKLIEN